MTLVVGGIGVSNIMNVVVEERTREIGIKMALGARPGSILFQFMLETLMITGVGGAIGLGITFGHLRASSPRSASRITSETPWSPPPSPR